MARFIIPIVIALAIIVGCVIYLNYDTSINSGTDNVLYNDIIYERVEVDYNLTISEENSKYIGDFSQIYAYGQEYLYEVRVLNGEANMLYSAHAAWLKPGYSLPSPYGEDFVYAEYVVSEGIDFQVIPDNYKEEVTPLATFAGSVKLEDIIESESSDITVSEEAIEECNEIRFKYKNHADIYLLLAIYEHDGAYYLDVRHAKEGTHEWFKIRDEYVEMLTSAIA
ncbi:MAG: hypothetical protein J6V09_01685 [Clostridia bacterium]|nr:hypothetical protein [Clostridia bacterium]